MKWNPFDYISPSIERTKKLLFPFDLKYWTKLTIVSILSGNLGGGNGGGGRGSVRAPISKVNSNSSITGNIIAETGKNTGFIGAIIFFAAIIGVILTIISSVFSFIFIDALVKRKYTIRDSWKKYGSSGLSYFWFRIVFGIIVLGVFLIIALPLIIKISGVGFMAYFSTYGFFKIFFDFLPYVIIGIIWFLIISVFGMFVKDFVLVDMYMKGLRVKESLKRVFSAIRGQKKESLVYWVSKVVITICIFIILMAALLAFLLAGILIGLALFFLLKLISLLFAIIVIVIFAIAVLFAYCVGTLPLNVFARYFTIECYQRLMSFSNKK